MREVLIGDDKLEIFPEFRYLIDMHCIGAAASWLLSHAAGVRGENSANSSSTTSICRSRLVDRSGT